MKSEDPRTLPDRFRVQFYMGKRMFHVGFTLLNVVVVVDVAAAAAAATVAAVVIS